MKSSYSSLCAVITFCALCALASAQSNIVLRHSNRTGGTLRAVAVGSTRLVAVGDRGLILSSPDGETWTQQEAPGSESLYGVAFSNMTDTPLTISPHGRKAFADLSLAPRDFFASLKPDGLPKLQAFLEKRLPRVLRPPAR